MRISTVALVLACGCADGDGSGVGDDASISDASSESASESASASASAGDGSCEQHDECAAGELCFDGACSLAEHHVLQLTVLDFGGCMVDGWGDAEVFLKVYRNGEQELRSLEHPCPASWPNEPILFSSEDVIEIEFWELDAFVDDLLASYCWDDGGACDVVPVDDIRAGALTKSWGDGLWVDLEIGIVD